MDGKNSDRHISGDSLIKKYLPLVSWVIVFIALSTALQVFVPYPVDDDTAYHFTVGQLIRKYGILHAFPWTPFSTQFDHYADKEFFFHLLFVPLGGLGFVTAARVVGAFAGALALTTLYLILRAEKVRYAGIWALLPLTCSEFVFRFALVRPHLLSITLALTVMWALSRGRLPVLAAAGLIYPLSYVAFWQIPLILLVAVEAARLAVGEQIRWKPAATLCAGIIAGTLLHPNTVNLLRINWIHMADILFQRAWGKNVNFSLGKEFNPYTPEEWARYLVLIAAMAVAALIVGWRERRTSSVSLGAAFAAVIFGLLTVRSLRFTEYFVPFSVAALALAAGSIRVRRLAPSLLGVSLLYMLAVGTGPFSILASKGPYIEPDIARYFSQQVPVGSQVFTCGWDYTGNLMLALPERRFMVAADPTLFYLKDPKLYDIWHTMTVSTPLDSAEAIRRLFRSRFVICLNYPAYWNFFDTLERDPKVRNLYSDQRWVLFDLGESSEDNTQVSTGAR